MTRHPTGLFHKDTTPRAALDETAGHLNLSPLEGKPAARAGTKWLFLFLLLRTSEYSLQLRNAHWPNVSAVLTVRPVPLNARGPDNRLFIRPAELLTEPAAGPMERNVDGIWLQSDDPAHLARREARAVAKREKLTLATVQPAERSDEIEPSHSVAFLVASACLVALGDRKVRLSVQRVGDAALRDAEQPGDRRSSPRVVRRAVPHRTLEHLTRHVLRIRARPHMERYEGIHAAD
jgi:hypothetical protein